MTSEIFEGYLCKNVTTIIEATNQRDRTAQNLYQIVVSKLIQEMNKNLFANHQLETSNMPSGSSLGSINLYYLPHYDYDLVDSGVWKLVMHAINTRLSMKFFESNIINEIKIFDQEGVHLEESDEYQTNFDKLSNIDKFLSLPETGLIDQLFKSF